MKSEKNQNAINSSAYAHLISLLSKEVKVMDLSVEGKWLRAVLSSGVIFSVKNGS